jgi:hypothetical protein
MKTALKIFVAALAITGGASAAQAATDLGTLTGDTSSGISSTTSILPTASGEYDFTFTVGSNTLLSEIDAISNKYASALSYELYSGSTLLATVVGVATGNDLEADQDFTLASGSYLLKVFETASAAGSASFGGTVSVSAVPLPGAVMLFGAGLAGLGVASRRRKATAAV